MKDYSDDIDTIVKAQAAGSIAKTPEIAVGILEKLDFSTVGQEEVGQEPDPIVEPPTDDNTENENNAT